MTIKYEIDDLNLKSILINKYIYILNLRWQVYRKPLLEVLIKD